LAPNENSSRHASLLLRAVRGRTFSFTATLCAGAAHTHVRRSSRSTAALFRRQSVWRHTRQEKLEGVDQIDLRIVTVKDRHLLTHARIPAESFTHVQVDIDPLTLGFHAHTILQENAGKYDYYVYLEDDILIEDPDLFLKIGYLNRAATQAGITNALFQPQRYESALGLGAREKQLYNAIVMDYQTELRASERVLAAEYLGRRVHFEVTTLPHAGCFFLNEQQLNTLVGKENFGHLDRMWVTPLDTAATYAIGMNFKVYKPVLSDYLFLAVRHGCEVISDKLESGHLRIENGRPVGWLNK